VDPRLDGGTEVDVLMWPESGGLTIVEDSAGRGDGDSRRILLRWLAFSLRLRFLLAGASEETLAHVHAICTR
jgi:hypothetical protein